MVFDRAGNRKYLTEIEWRSFLSAADEAAPETRAFCWTLAYTGGRLTEIRSLTPRCIDPLAQVIRIECLKRRQRGVFREIPASDELFGLLEATFSIESRRTDQGLSSKRLWSWSRTTAWSRVKTVMKNAGLLPHLCVPKALRHSFGIEGVLHKRVPIGLMQKWMGHARIESTLVYTTPVGRDERREARRMWRPETQHPASA